MKQKYSPQHQDQKPPGPTGPAAIEELKEESKNYVPSPDEVARKAYFSYKNEGSLPGREVQHWLAAEAELIAERNLTRVHGFHNKT
jgi:hypothetical protein